MEPFRVYRQSTIEGITGRNCQAFRGGGWDGEEEQ
jgi:hypothetical protein